MIAFLRRWYIAVALVWWLCGLAVFLAVARSPFRPGSLLFWVLMLIPVIVPAVLLASRGFRHTTTLRVFVSIYAVVLIPAGLLAFAADVHDHARFPNVGWTNVNWWLAIGLEGGFLAAPVVLVSAFILCFFINLVAADEADD
jgi:hypothetical protein